jgi:hypothetical protein
MGTEVMSTPRMRPNSTECARVCSAKFQEKSLSPHLFMPWDPNIASALIVCDVPIQSDWQPAFPGCGESRDFPELANGKDMKDNASLLPRRVQISASRD